MIGRLVIDVVRPVIDYMEALCMIVNYSLLVRIKYSTQYNISYNSRDVTDGIAPCTTEDKIQRMYDWYEYMSEE